MKKFIQKWILHNLIYKIIALAIAFVVWVTFTYSDDPIKTYSVEAAVTVLHADEYAAQGRYIAINGTDDFTNMKEIVFLRGRSSVLDILRNKAVSSYMNVYVDLYELESDENRLLIHYEMLDPSINAELYSIRNKSYYEVEVEESVSKDIPVKYVIIGKPAEGYMFFEDDPEIMVSPSSITISGPEKQVEDIASAQVTVNVANASANVNKTGILVLQNTNGEPVTYSRDVIWASISEAAVFVPIYTYKSVVVQPYLSGSAPAGYEYTGDVSVDHTSVTIYGPESIMNKVLSISLPSIELANVTGAYEETYDIQEILDDIYGEGVVRVLYEEETEVTVSFSVGQQISQVVSFPVDAITVYGLDSSLELTFEDTDPQITVFGLQEAMEDFDPKEMTVALRLTSAQKAPGTYTIALEVGGLGGLQYRAVTVRVRLTEKASDSNI